MPHIDIKHFPVDLDKQSKDKFIEIITAAIKSTFRCDEDAISIALESVDPSEWDERVYNMEIVKREKLLCKRPGYGLLAKTELL